MYNFDTVRQLKDELKENFDAQDYQLPSWPEIEADVQQGESRYIKTLIDRIQKAFVASLPDLEYVPLLTRYIFPKGVEGSPAITRVSLTVRGSSKAAFAYSESKEFVVDPNFEDAVKVFFYGVFSDLIDRAAQYNNVIDINEELKSITDDAETNYAVSLSLSGDSADAIEYIDDTNIVFRVDREKVFNPKMEDILFKSSLDDLGLSENELARYTKALDKIHDANVAEFRSLATTPEFVAAKPNIIRSFVKVEYFQPYNLIKKSLHRTAAVLKNSKKDERFRVEGDGFMGIGQRVDGQLGVSLHPFDAKTCKPVDVNILEGLKD